MKRSRTAVGVATSTLEIGIDIGNIDLIVLAEIPWSISALLQRVGRGNRREGIVRAAAIVKSSDERLLLQTMVDAARDGALGGEPYYPDFSVVAQQVLSYAYQNPDGIPEDEFLSLLTVLCTEPQARLVLDFLRQRQWLTFMRGRWYRLNKLTDLGDRGEIHSNIPDNSSLRVIDIATGREIGAIGGVYDDIFLLARQAWQVVTIENGLIRARRFQGKATPAMFSRHTDSGKFSYLLPPSLR